DEVLISFARVYLERTNSQAREADLDTLLEDLTKALVKEALVRAEGNVSQAARLIGSHHSRIFTRLKDWGINTDDFKGEDVTEKERAKIVEAIQQTNGNVAEAARKLGLPSTTLRYRMMKYGIKP